MRSLVWESWSKAAMQDGLKNVRLKVKWNSEWDHCIRAQNWIEREVKGRNHLVKQCRVAASGEWIASLNRNRLKVNCQAETSELLKWEQNVHTLCSLLHFSHQFSRVLSFLPSPSSSIVFSLLLCFPRGNIAIQVLPRLSLARDVVSILSQVHVLLLFPCHEFALFNLFSSLLLFSNSSSIHLPREHSAQLLLTTHD